VSLFREEVLARKRKELHCDVVIPTAGPTAVVAAVIALFLALLIAVAVLAPFSETVKVQGVVQSNMGLVGLSRLLLPCC
jgi:hypothetical protein